MSYPPNARPAKRPRAANDPQDTDSSTSSAATGTKLKLRRHEEFWFRDGNLVLVAQHTGFRIYRGPLSSQSTVFSDMFASSTSKDAKTFDEYPVVHLSDDLVHLMDVIVPKTRIHYQAMDTDPVLTFTFEEVSALVRVGQEDHIQQMKDTALAALQLYDFTSDFKTFCKGTPEDYKLIIKPEEYIGAVNLARLTDTPSMLPLAFYNCASLGSTLLNGWKRLDGTVEQLSPSDLRQCIDGRVTLGRQQFSALLAIFQATVSPRCYCSDHCEAGLRTIRDAVVLDWDSTDNMALVDWTTAIRGYSEKHDLCESCDEMLVKRNWRERRKIWNKLPEIFGVEVKGWGRPESKSEPDDGQ